MTWSGKISEISLETVLRGLIERRAVGHLSLRSGDVFITFQIGHGRVTGLDVEGADEMRLGQLLLMGGQIDEKQLKSALKKQKRNKMPIGSVLSGQGVILKDTLTKFLHLQCRELMMQGMTWQDGDFNFSPGESATRLPSMDPLDLASIIKEWERQRQHMPTIVKWVPNRHQVYQKRGRLEDYFKKQKRNPGDQIELDAEEKKSVVGKNERLVFSYINGKADVYQLSRMAALTDFRTRVALANLLSVKLVSRVQTEGDLSEQQQKKGPLATHSARQGVKSKTRKKPGKSWMSSGTKKSMRAGVTKAIAQTTYFLILGVLAFVVIANFPVSKKYLLKSPTLHGERFRHILQEHQKKRMMEALSIYYLETMSYPPNLEKLRSVELIFKDDLEQPFWTTSNRYVADPEGQRYTIQY